MKDAGNGSFVCPNDRQLQLRAKLNSGWSFHTGRTPTRSASAAPSNRFGSAASAAARATTSNGNQVLRDDELERIKKVLERAQRIENTEQERVGRLIDRLDNMKKHAAGNGSSQCVLCADGFGMLGAAYVSCVDCHKCVCNKCSIETVYNQQVISLCKICSENRELWKKSGAWFFRALPSRSALPSSVKPSSSAISSVTAQSDSISIDDDSSSDDRHSNSNRLNPRPSAVNTTTTTTAPTTTTAAAATPNNHYTTVSSYPQNHENSYAMADYDRDESLDSFKTDERNSKELSIDDYISKAHARSSSQPPASSSPSRSLSIASSTAASSTQIRPISSAATNSSSSNDDLGFGSLDFDIIWEEALNLLKIKLFRARNLRSGDSNGLSDPYIKVHLVPGVAKATKLRSHTIRRTLNPEFDETLVYHGISCDDIKNKSLKFSVLDEDSMGADFLGEYRLKLSSIRPDVKETYSVYLQQKTDDIEIPADNDVNERGKVLVSLLYSKLTSSFHVKLLRGSQLLPMDFGQTSDPYCKLSLSPCTDASAKWTFKSSVKKNTLQPEFNEEFVFPHLPLQELISKTLQITVYDKDMGKKDDYIGGFELGQSASGDELRHWLLMVKSPGQWIEMWHRLKPEHYNSFLRQRDSQTSR